MGNLTEPKLKYALTGRARRVKRSEKAAARKHRPEHPPLPELPPPRHPRGARGWAGTAPGMGRDSPPTPAGTALGWGGHNPPTPRAPHPLSLWRGHSHSRLKQSLPLSSPTASPVRASSTPLRKADAASTQPRCSRDLLSAATALGFRSLHTFCNAQGRSNRHRVD